MHDARNFSCGNLFLFGKFFCATAYAREAYYLRALPAAFAAAAARAGAKAGARDTSAVIKKAVIM